LKHISTLSSFGLLVLSALDPGKQGLKQPEISENSPDFGLSALDPGKQGLKQIFSISWALRS